MMKEISIDEKLAIIREAIEKGADVNLSFHGVISKTIGEEIINRMAELTGAKVYHSKDIQLFNFECLTNPKGLRASVFYELSKEEHKENIKKQIIQLQEELA
ncbi:hypothetical protein J1P26_07255 [Neobacillus sp. MM2021_6]|uniref:hypothetical protein n=1 Tax=Bacillaceae TaxID=186817 RepID=UPI0014072AAC|nr:MULTISPECIES: hypothetical protein [Bacillaceae]MBO0959529.1 hypothetical protein [Neobacillus sp. MM2021_6]NHC17173.1 hypothetical protein [Bacillus sp. MM2020_4]